MSTQTTKDLLKSALDSAVATIEARAKARMTKWIKACAALNDDLEPTVDSLGRLHAPCNGYEYDDHSYQKGEFIHTPPEVYEALIEEGFIINVRQRDEFPHKFKIKVTSKITEELKELSANYHFKCSFGKSWEDGDNKICYAYIETVNPAYQQELEKAITAAMKGIEGQVVKGDAPAGKQTVTGRVACIKLEPNPYGYRAQPTPKVFVILENNATVYGTLPSSLYEAESGTLITFTATFEHAKNDSTHAYFKRPTKAQIISQPETK